MPDSGHQVSSLSPLLSRAPAPCSRSRTVPTPRPWVRGPRRGPCKKEREERCVLTQVSHVILNIMLARDVVTVKDTMHISFFLLAFLHETKH